MLIPTEAIAIVPAIAGNPRLFGNPQIRPPGLRNPPSTVPTGFPLAIPERLITRLLRKGGYPQTRGGLSLLPRIFRRHQHLPLVSAAVTGMFHTIQTVTIRPRRTLPDSAGLPPVLSSTNMCPYNKTHSSLGKANLRRSCAPSDYISLRQFCTKQRGSM